MQFIHIEVKFIHYEINRYQCLSVFALIAGNADLEIRDFLKSLKFRRMYSIGTKKCIDGNFSPIHLNLLIALTIKSRPC